MPQPLYIDRTFASLEELCRVLVEHYWHRAPVVFRNHGLGEVFGGSCELVDGLRSLRGLHSPPRIYADGKRMEAAEPHWCGSDDASLEAYVERLARGHDAREIAIVTDGFERSSADLWFRFARFATALYSTLGFPVGESQVNVFAGTYSRTPFGFHKDVGDTVTYALAGRKRYLVWDYEIVARRLPLPEGARHDNIRYERYDYTRLMSEAIVLDTEPGDLFYWPWDCFHIAEPTKGELSVSITFGIVPFAPPSLAEAERVAKRGLYAMRSEPLCAGEQPDPVAGHAEALRRALDDEAVLDTWREELLFRRTRFGFKRPLPEVADAAPLDDDDRLAPPLPNLIAWTPNAGGLLVSANGRGFRTDEHPGLVELLAEINRGEPLRVGDLRARYCATGILDDEDLDAVLRCLLRFRALGREVPVTGARAIPRPSAPLDPFRQPGLFPLRLVDDGASVLLAPIADHQHASIEGFETRAHRVPLRWVLEQHERNPPPAQRRRYVLTQGYSGSTLLCRCIDAVPGCLTVHEPQVLGDWSLRYGALRDPEERRAWLHALEPLVALLFRAGDPATKVVVKVGPHVQEVMEELLGLGAQPAGVHLYTSLPAFLANTLKDPKRRAELQAAARAPQRAIMADRIGAPRVDASGLLDARAIAYVWLTDLEAYHWLLTRPPGAALRALELDGFLDAPVQGLRALSDHLELGLAPGAEAELAGRDLFRRHAKRDRTEPFDRTSRAAAIAAQRLAYDAEIRDALAWARRVWDGALPERLRDDLLDEATPVFERRAVG